MSETNGKVTPATDPFRFDKPEEDEGQHTTTSVRDGEVVVKDGTVTRQSFLHEQDVPSIFLRGVIPGATSAEAGEDPNFKPITDGVTPEGVQLTDEQIREIQNASNRRYKTDPHYAGIIDSYKVFVIGKGFHVTAVDEMEEVGDYLKKFMKANKMDGRDRDTVEEVFKSGEVFIRKFTKAGDKAALIPVVRMLRYYEISKIVRDEKDPETVLSYSRPYKTSDGKTEVEDIPASEIFHIKFGDQKRGTPPFMVILMQCAYYDDWLFNRIVFNRLKTAFYLEEIVDGSPAAVSAQDTMTPDAIRKAQRGKVIKRVPKPGSKITHNKAVEYKWLKPEVGAEDAKEDGRAIRMAICAGAKVPEFVLGDASNGNYASTVVSQNPFVRNIEWFQDFFAGPFSALYEWAIEFGIAAKAIPANSTETVARERVASLPWYRRIPREIKASINKVFEKAIQEYKVGTVLKEAIEPNGQLVTRKVVPTNTEVHTNWPNLIAQDLLKDSQAYAIHQSLGIVSNETLAQRLGYDWEEEQQKMDQEQVDQQQDNADPEAAQRDAEIAKGKEDPAAGSAADQVPPAGGAKP